MFTKRHSFHDYKLSSAVEYAYHAVAIDEQRRYFQPALWEKEPKDVQQTMEQVWFVGVHCDVGGGYIAAGLSDIALKWMTDKAMQAGLGLKQLEIQPDFMQTSGNSRTGFYRLIPPYQRKIDQQIEGTGKESCETLHLSVLERYQNDKTYRPQNLVDYLRCNKQDLW